MWWMILAGIALLGAATFAPTIEVGPLALDRNHPGARLLFVAIGVMALLLLVAVPLAMRGRRVAIMVLRYWGMLYGTVSAAIVFFVLDVRDASVLVVALVFALVWYVAAVRATTASDG
jgi:hypothetical protein